MNEKWPDVVFGHTPAMFGKWKSTICDVSMKNGQSKSRSKIQVDRIK